MEFGVNIRNEIRSGYFGMDLIWNGIWNDYFGMELNTQWKNLNMNSLILL